MTTQLQFVVNKLKALIKAQGLTIEQVVKALEAEKPARKEVKTK